MELNRSDPCHCGSGKKYMHCCMRQDLKAKAAKKKAEPSSSEPPPVLEGGVQASLSAVSEQAAELPEQPPSPPPDPSIAAFNARWEEFEAQDYEGQIALFVETLDEKELMDDEMAFEMLNIIYYKSVEHGERDRFDALVKKLRERLPDVYAHDAHYYLDWQITNALAMGRVDAIPTLAREMALTAGEHIDTFNNILDCLAYHGHLSTLVEAVRIAWPHIQSSTKIALWGVDEFAMRAADYELFAYLERQPSPRADDPDLIERFEFYLEVDQERLTRYVAYLTGQVERHWTLDDFKLKSPGRRSGVFMEGVEDVAQGPGWQNLYDLSVEFVGDLRREKGVPYTKGEMGREQLVKYILSRHVGELEPRESGFEEMRQRRKSRRKRRKPGHLLCPDRDTLDRFLSDLLYFLSLQYYKAAATFELIPDWLRFLESRQLLDAEQRAETMQKLRGMHPALKKIWKNYTSDPALERGLEGWGAE